MISDPLKTLRMNPNMASIDCSIKLIAANELFLMHLKFVVATSVPNDSPSTKLHCKVIFNLCCWLLLAGAETYAMALYQQVSVSSMMKNKRHPASLDPFIGTDSPCSATIKRTMRSFSLITALILCSLSKYWHFFVLSTK